MESVTSWEFVKDNYRADDRVAVVIRNRAQDYTVQRLLTATDAASPRFQRFLRYENARGADIYVSMNTLKPDAKGRAKADIAAVRHLYLDLDEEGDARLERVLQSHALPKPNYVLDTSPGKHHVIWKVQGFTVEQAEAALRLLAREFGGDPAATDAARVLRLPCFHNKKFAEPVRVEGHRLATAPYIRADFAGLREGVSPEQIKPDSVRVRDNPSAQAPDRHAGNRILSQSERDWAWVRDQLRAGVPPDAVKQALAARRTDKPKPDYYADRTVRRALEH